MKFEKFKEKIVNLQGDLNWFKAEFLDKDGFREFANNLCDKTGCYSEVCMTGYFSETIRKELEKLVKRGCHVKLICPEFPEKPNTRDRKNLQALKELAYCGAEIKVNSRLHARFLVAYSSQLVKERDGNEWMNGLLVIGSFDFNAECIGLERHDAGIKTQYPDLVESAAQLFEKIWRETGSVDLLKKYLKE
jgi:hypothetical protein